MQRKNFSRELTFTRLQSRWELAHKLLRSITASKQRHWHFLLSLAADLCGASITRLEKTYYHSTEEKTIINALADYEYKDGLLVLIVTN